MEQTQKHCLPNIAYIFDFTCLKKYFQKDKSQLSIFSVHWPAHLNNIWQFFFFFGFCYKLSNFLAIIDGYYIWLSSDWNLIHLKDLLSNICLFAGGQAILTNHWKVEYCTVILILSSNKTIRTLTSYSITQIVNQKGV